MSFVLIIVPRQAERFSHKTFTQTKNLNRPSFNPTLGGAHFLSWDSVFPINTNPDEQIGLFCDVAYVTGLPALYAILLYVSIGLWFIRVLCFERC
jgi:hypothetical protein